MTGFNVAFRIEDVTVGTRASREVHFPAPIQTFRWTHSNLITGGKNG